MDYDLRLRFERLNLSGLRVRVAAIGVTAIACVLASAGTASATVFNGDGGVTIPATGSTAPGAPYPQTLTVPGTVGGVTNGLVTDIEIGLVNLTHTDLADVGAVVVSPGGKAFLLFDGINGGSVSAINVSFDDQASGVAPNTPPLAGGTYKPTARFSTDSFPSPGPLTAYDNPGPVGGTATLQGTFGGFLAAGVWKLYVVDFVSGNGGSIGLWNMNITTGTPGATLTPANQGFAPRDPVEAPGASTTFTFTNTGATPLHIDSAFLGGTHPGDFDITEDNCTAQTVPATGADTCTVKVAFDPSAVGNTDAQLRVQIADFGTPSSNLSGTGKQLASLDSGSFSFGARDIASGPSASHTFVLSNGATDVDVNVTGVALTGGNPGEFAITSNLCNGTALSPAETCAVQVAFDPASAGAKAATLRFTSDAPTPTTDAALTGEGTTTTPLPGGGGQASQPTGQRAAALAKCQKKKGKAKKKCKAKALKLPV